MAISRLLGHARALEGCPGEAAQVPLELQGVLTSETYVYNFTPTLVRFLEHRTWAGTDVRVIIIRIILDIT